MRKCTQRDPAHPQFRTFLAAGHALKGDHDRATAELAGARSLVGDDRYSSIARLRAVESWGVPKICSLVETTSPVFAGPGAGGMNIRLCANFKDIVETLLSRPFSRRSVSLGFDKYYPADVVHVLELRIRSLIFAKWMLRSASSPTGRYRKQSTGSGPRGGNSPRSSGGREQRPSTTRAAPPGGSAPKAAKTAH